MINENIQTKINEWLGFDKETKNELEKLLKNKKQNEKELIDRFYKNLEFGTGGLRGIMGAGTNRMNIYTVGMVATGIANYIIKNKETNPSVVIAYDSRNMSDAFSLRSALIFAANNIKAYLFNTLTATPILSFAIRELNATAGVMVTASHNPPEYNGYKVYYKDGAQVLPPNDIGIIEEVKNIKSIKDIKVANEDNAKKTEKLIYLNSSFYKKYYDKIMTLLANPRIISEMKENIKVVFTPLHGAARQPIEEALKKAGLKELYTVKEQREPDGKFPTVDYPNPEEPEALKLAIKLAKEKKADILFATDPDGDRLGIAANDGNNNFILFNGNQVGILFTYYILSQMQKKNTLSKNALIIKTIVSTDLVKEICKSFNVHIEEVLTGFKYIAQRVNIYHDIENKKNREFILGFEESYGYNLGDFVRDKDSVISALLITEIAAFCKKNGKNIIDFLDDIYNKYGYYFETLKSITLKGKTGIDKIKDIMNFFRNNPPKQINGIEVVQIRDVNKNTIINTKTKELQHLNLPKSNVLTFYLANAASITLRPSGTEPKIKFYFSYSMKGKDIKHIKKEVYQNINKLSDSFMEIVENSYTKE